jgi:hypothetical protein
MKRVIVFLLLILLSCNMFSDGVTVKTSYSPDGTSNLVFYRSYNQKLCLGG